MEDNFVVTNFIPFIIFIIIIVLIIFVILYFLYFNNLNNNECNAMTKLYGTINGSIIPLNTADPNCSHNFCDYYIKTAYNACSGGSYKNDFVNICNLENIIKQGVRALDFEIFSLHDQPIVSTSTSSNYNIKETYNSVPFLDIMKTIKNRCFSSDGSPNYSDPVIVHLRFQSSNQSMYSNLSNILKQYDSILLEREYSFENNRNLGSVKLLDLLGKIIIIVDRSNASFMDNPSFPEFVNMTSNSVYMRSFKFSDIQHIYDVTEIQEYNKTCMTIVLPDNTPNPVNPNTDITRELGCQLTAMCFQNVDKNLQESNAFFDNCKYAFCLKPVKLQATT